MKYYNFIIEFCYLSVATFTFLAFPMVYKLNRSSQKLKCFIAFGVKKSITE